MAVIITTISTDSFNKWLSDSNINFTNINSELVSHLSATNPHNITAVQISALPITGGTITGSFGVDGITTLNSTSRFYGIAEFYDPNYINFIGTTTKRKISFNNDDSGISVSTTSNGDLSLFGNTSDGLTRTKANLHSSSIEIDYSAQSQIRIRTSVSNNLSAGTPITDWVSDAIFDSISNTFNLNTTFNNNLTVTGSTTTDGTITANSLGTFNAGVTLSTAGNFVVDLIVPTTINGTFSTTNTSSFGGNVTITSPNELFFESINRQSINLFGTSHGIGTQTGTTYFRSDVGFAFYAGGSHSASGAGVGGTVLATLDATSLTVNPDVNLNGNLNITGNITTNSSVFVTNLNANYLNGHPASYFSGAQASNDWAIAMSIALG